MFYSIISYDNGYLIVNSAINNAYFRLQNIQLPITLFFITVFMIAISSYRLTRYVQDQDHQYLDQHTSLLLGSNASCLLSDTYDYYHWP